MARLTYITRLLTMNELNITTLCDKIDFLTKEDNRKAFIENYTDCKNKINYIDSIIEQKNDIDDKLDLSILYESLTQYEHKIATNELNIDEFKCMMNIVECINKKTQNSELNIINIP